MTYVVEAIDLDPEGKPLRLRWHAVADDEQATRGQACVVSIEEALVQSAGEPVYLAAREPARLPLMRMRVDDKETFVDASDAAEGELHGGHAADRLGVRAFFAAGGKCRCEGISRSGFP